MILVHSTVSIGKYSTGECLRFKSKTYLHFTLSLGLGIWFLVSLLTQDESHKNM